MLSQAAPSPTVVTRNGPLDRWVEVHPMWSFVALTYAISWSCWALSWLVAGRSAWRCSWSAASARRSPRHYSWPRAGSSLRAWIRGLLRRRVPAGTTRTRCWFHPRFTCA